MENTVATSKQYQPGNMKKSTILERLRWKGCRITRQREVLIDVILQENCTCCKEIYFMAMKKDPNIGMATIYRMVNLLEEIGALRWRNEYQILDKECTPVKDCLIELEDSSCIELEGEALKKILEKGMESCGYPEGQKVRKIIARNI